MYNCIRCNTESNSSLCIRCYNNEHKVTIRDFINMLTLLEKYVPSDYKGSIMFDGDQDEIGFNIPYDSIPEEDMKLLYEEYGIERCAVNNELIGTSQFLTA